MKLKLLDIWIAVPELNKHQTEIPAKIAYKLARLKSILEERYIEINKQKNELVNKYGVLNENKQLHISSKPEHKDKKDKFIKEFDDLLKEECDILFDSVITQNDLEKIEASIQFIQAIQFCINEDNT